jgi:hypothetical protein
MRGLGLRNQVRIGGPQMLCSMGATAATIRHDPAELLMLTALHRSRLRREAGRYPSLGMRKSLAKPATLCIAPSTRLLRE